MTVEVIAPVISGATLYSSNYIFDLIRVKVPIVVNVLVTKAIPS